METLQQQHGSPFLTPYVPVPNGNGERRPETTMAEEELSFPVFLFEADKCLFALAMESGFRQLAIK